MRPPATILAAIDDSEMTRPVLAWVRLLAERFPESRRVLLHVIDPMFAGAVKIAASDGEERKAAGELRWTAEGWLAERVRAEGLPPDRTRTEVGLGVPGRAASRNGDASRTAPGRAISHAPGPFAGRSAGSLRRRQ